MTTLGGFVLQLMAMLILTAPFGLAGAVGIDRLYCWWADR